MHDSLLLNNSINW